VRPRGTQTSKLLVLWGKMRQTGKGKKYRRGSKTAKQRDLLRNMSGKKESGVKEKVRGARVKRKKHKDCGEPHTIFQGQGKKSPEKAPEGWVGNRCF